MSDKKYTRIYQVLSEEGIQLIKLDSPVRFSIGEGKEQILATRPGAKVTHIDSTTLTNFKIKL